MTRLTFGIPVYNGERFLPAALSSVQEQRLADIRIVISDNASTDGTEEYCRAAAAADDRITYLRNDVNRGAIWNFREVERLATTELFSWMAADDVKLPDFAGETIAALDAAGPVAVFACPRTRLIDAEGTVYEDLDDSAMGLDAGSPAERVRNLLRSQASHAMYGVIRTPALRAARPAIECAGTDLVLLVELLCRGRMALAPGQTFLQRHHDGQASMRAVRDADWVAPRAHPNLSFAETRTNVELYRGVARSGIGAAQVAKAWGSITADWVVPRRRAMGRDVLNALGVRPGTGRLDWQRRAQASATAGKQP